MVDRLTGERVDWRIVSTSWPFYTYVDVDPVVDYICYGRKSFDLTLDSD